MEGTPTTAGHTVPNRYPQIYGFMGTFLPLATIAIILRITSRLKFSRIGYDDIAACIAYVAFIGVIAANFVSLKYGFGKHIWDIDIERTGVDMEKCVFIAQICYPISQACIKLSALLFLARVIPSTSSWRKRLWVIAAFVVAQETSSVFTLLFQCRPIRYYWDKEMSPPGTCINQSFFYYFDASVNIFTDVLILTLPWLIFSSLRIQRSKKYALLAICSSGVFTLVSSSMRIPYLYSIQHTRDETWTAVSIATWTMAELGSAVTTASIPTIKPLVTWIFPRFTFSSAGESTEFSDFSGDDVKHVALHTIGGRSIVQSKNYKEIESGRSGSGNF